LQRFREEAQPLLAQIEEKREAVVVPVFYSMSRFIASPDVDVIYDALRSIGPQPKIDVIIFSAGGTPDQAYIIGAMFQEFAKQKLVVMVPRYAKSAATLLVCAADEILMLPPSELGPIDPVVESPEIKRPIPVLSLLELLDMIGKMPKPLIPGLTTISDVIEKMLSKVPIAEFGDYARLTDHMISLAEMLLSRRMFHDNPNDAKTIAENLCKRYKAHSAAITLVDAKELGLKLIDAPKELQDAIWSLHKLWVDTVIEYENDFPEGASLEAVNFNVGRGAVFCTRPVEGRTTSASTKTEAETENEKVGRPSV